MQQDDIYQLHDEVYYLLEPHASFLSGCEREDVRHFLPNEYLESLSWLTIYIVIPILTNAVGSILANFLKHEKEEKILQVEIGPRVYLNGPRTINDEFKERETVVRQQEELALMMQELSIVYQNIENNCNPTKESISSAKEELYEVLLVNGFPTNIALKESDRIIQLILGHFSGEVK
jgi:hypothetical protein